MSEQWRILVVEDDEQVNQSTVNSLRKDGYFVQGVKSGAEAIRILWTEEYDVVIGDLKMPGAAGLEMLQWLRAYRPHTYMIMLAADASPASRTSALEGGVASYLQKPLDLHLLKEELRRLLQQTGFSASLASFDLLDVIQIITMSRKSIALVVNTGPDERGILCFKGRELVWAEFGPLRGEEAFFALAAYKNGTVTQQAWHEQVKPNVRQPLSHLIFQALQYRSKYSALQPLSGEHEALPRLQPLQEEDRPFPMLAEETQHATMGDPVYQHQHAPGESAASAGEREWWQPTDKSTGLAHKPGQDKMQAAAPGFMETPAACAEEPLNNANDVNIALSDVHKTAASQRTDLPSWLTDLSANFAMPTESDKPTLRPSALLHSSKVAAEPPTRPVQPHTPPIANTADQLPQTQDADLHQSLAHESEVTTPPAYPRSLAKWQPPVQVYPSPAADETLPTLLPVHKIEDNPTSDGQRKSGLNNNTARLKSKLDSQRSNKRNYPALVSALQAIGYAIPGFIATAVVSLDGQPIAQVAIDDLDISPACAHFSRILQGALLSLADGHGGKYEDAVITSRERYILLRVIDSDREAFQVLITTRESDPAESRAVMVNVEGSIGAALH